jgi:hypothetical protein
MKNPPAFPRIGEGFGNPVYETEGMTLRDYFAAKAMAALIVSVETPDAAKSYGKAAEWAYQQADAMLKAREQ